ncbi:MAG: 2-polyprenylphenol 6-hydroxylase, partial [Clostridiaceae bacterium]|nr:2-polyprenylphenol 6-hydroxylase [Clostridiaceae bacterium]
MNRNKNLKRLQHIIQVFVKHGFGTLIDQTGLLRHLNLGKKILQKAGETESFKYTSGQRLRLALEELGPTFIKLGQIISTRPDILSPDIIRELEKLQDSVPPISFEEVKNVIEAELNDSLYNIFLNFEERPLAAASIAQVHPARLLSGRQVVVKVQRPDIENIIDVDVKILKDIAYFIDHHTKYGNLYDFGKMVEEFENTLKNEMDFMIEGDNTETFRKNFKNDKYATFPYISWIHTTKRVLTMELVDGIKLNDFEALEKAGLDRKIIARNLTSSIFNQILRDGFFHADPHPGNIMVLENNTIAFLDLGMVGKLSENRKNQFLKMLMGITLKNSKLIIEGIVNLDAVKTTINMKKLEKEIDILRDKYLSIPLSEIKMGDAFNQIFSLAFSYNIVIPNEFTMLAKTLITLEGIVEKLDPDLSVLEIAEPITEKLMIRLFSPEKLGKEVLSELMDYGNLTRKFPSYMLGLLEKAENDDISIGLKFKDFEKIIKLTNKISNRLSFSIILLAVCIVIAGILIGSGISANTGTESYLLNIAI